MEQFIPIFTVIVSVLFVLGSYLIPNLAELRSRRWRERHPVTLADIYAEKSRRRKMLAAEWDREFSHLVGPIQSPVDIGELRQVPVGYTGNTYRDAERRASHLKSIASPLDIQMLQRNAFTKGYYHGPIDGEPGPKLIEALQKIARNHLPPP